MYAITDATDHGELQTPWQTLADSGVHDSAQPVASLGKLNGPQLAIGTGRKQSRGHVPLYMTYSEPPYTITQGLDCLRFIQ